MGDDWYLGTSIGSLLGALLCVRKTRRLLKECHEILDAAETQRDRNIAWVQEFYVPEESDVVE